MNTIYFIQKEFLRTDITTDRPMKIWCGNSQLYGYSSDVDIVEKECKRLNKENKNKRVRYVVHEVDELI